MFGEPSPTQGDINFKLFGIPIRIHPLFWLVAVLLGASNREVLEILIWAIAVLVSILIHEFGHAMVVKAYGFHPWIILYGMGGLTCHDPRENNSSKANSTLGQMIISFAGPAAGFILVAALVLMLYLSGCRDQVKFGWIFDVIPVPIWMKLTPLAEFVNDIFLTSMFWGLLNLLPIYPLDGGQIVREFLLYMNPQDGIRQSLILSVFTAILVAVFVLIRLHAIFSGILFAYLAYENFMALQAYSRGGRW